MHRHALLFTAPRTLDIIREPLPALAPQQLLVETIVSAISAGTEMLIYRGQAPTELAADATIESLGGSLAFPLKYGYAAVGRVIDCGSAVSAEWRDKFVFAFNPHESHFIATPDSVVPLPADLSPELATLLPNMETAVSFAMDGRPVIGERVIVFGQGIVGLLTTLLLGQMPLKALTTVDAYARRRQQSAALGASQAIAPDAVLPSAEYDLAYELSGHPAVLNHAINALGYGGRVLVGSWYGRKQAPIDLGGAFHRNHIQLISSQVSTLAPAWRGRWTKARRFALALDMLQTHQPHSLITHRFGFADAADAYAQIDQHPNKTIQTLITWTSVQTPRGASPK